MSLIRALALAALTLCACTNPCEFRERCKGNVVESCVGMNDGPNVYTEPCEAPNEACVEPAENRAVCARAPAEACDASFQSRCDGNLRLFCNASGFVEASDCLSLGTSGCRVDADLGGAVCE